MEPHTVTTQSPAQTQALAEKLARLCRGGEIICLSGDLGAGKTTFVKGLARGLGLKEKNVNSPTFVIMNIYEGRLPLYHFDFYRFDDPREIGIVGYDEFLYGQGVAVIEWAERFGPLMPPEHLAADLVYRDEQTREIRFSSRGKKYHELLERLFL